MKKKKRIYCLQHVPFEGPGVFRPAFDAAGFDMKPVMVPRSGVPDDLPDALLVMGGAMSVHDSDDWLKAEKEFIHKAVEKGVPTIGVCLGAQLLADVYGGKVAPGPHFEIGLHEVKKSPAGKKDPCFKDFPATFEVFQWHGEGMKAPRGSKTLISSADYPVQAFRLKDHAYGLLFHCEVTAQTISDLCQAFPDDLRNGGKTRAKVEKSCQKALPTLHEYAETFVGGFTSSLF